MNLKLLRQIIREELERLKRERPIKEVLIMEKGADGTFYYHFSTIDEAHEFMREIEEDYKRISIKPIKLFPGVWEFGSIQYVLIIRRFNPKT